VVRIVRAEVSGTRNSAWISKSSMTRLSCRLISIRIRDRSEVRLVGTGPSSVVRS
jgi:hypothetical protein